MAIDREVRYGSIGRRPWPSAARRGLRCAAWPTIPRLTVALTFDHDSLSDSIRRGDSPVKLSHAEFGAPRRGAADPRAAGAARRSRRRGSSRARRSRLPGRHRGDPRAAATSSPATAGSTRTSRELDADEQRAILEPVDRGRRARDRRAAEGLPRAVLGARRARRSSVVEDAGFVYDSSLMADDYRPYRVRRGRSALRRPRARPSGPRARSSRCPVYWTLDDWPLFEPGDTAAMACGRRRRSSRSGSASCATPTTHAPGGLLTITMHPECIGRGHRMAMLEQFIAEAAALDGVVFERLDSYLASASAT